MKVEIAKYPNKGPRRKINIQIQKFDTWSLDHTLAVIILPALLQLKEQKMGIPGSIAALAGGEEYSGQICFDFYEETRDEAFTEVCKKWDEILDKIIWAFKQLAFDEYDDQYHHGVPKYKIKNTYVIDTNPSEHWYDIVGHRLHEDRIQEGLNLFSEYYRSLWD